MNCSIACLATSEPGRQSLLRAVAAAALVVGALAGCGGSDSPQTLSASGASQMRAHLVAVRTAAAGGDRRAATQALAAFAAEVSRERSAGHLSESRYAALKTATAHARDRIGVEVQPPPPVAAPVRPSVVAPAAPAPAGEGKGHGKGKGPKAHGKAKG